MNFSTRYKVKLIGFYKQLSNGFYSSADLATSLNGESSTATFIGTLIVAGQSSISDE